MKTPVCLLAGLTGLFVPAAALCAATVDVEKEKAAVIAVIEEEKNAFLALDDARMTATWIQRPTSMKLFVFDGKQTRLAGFDAIRQADQEYLQRRRTSGDRPRVEFSNFHVTVQGDSAWVVCDAHWSGTSEGTTFTGTQVRTNVLQKENGRWKIALMAISQLTYDKAGDAAVVEQELMQLEHNWAKAYVARDVATLNRILAAEWVFTDQDGNFMTKADDLRDVSSGNYAPLSVEASAMTVRVAGDTAVVTGRWTETTKKDGAAITKVVQFTDTFIRRDGRWQCLAGHGSVVAQKQ